MIFHKYFLDFFSSSKYVCLEWEKWPSPSYEDSGNVFSLDSRSLLWTNLWVHFTKSHPEWDLPWIFTLKSGLSGCKSHEYETSFKSHIQKIFIFSVVYVQFIKIHQITFKLSYQFLVLAASVLG